MTTFTMIVVAAMLLLAGLLVWAFVYSSKKVPDTEVEATSLLEIEEEK